MNPPLQVPAFHCYPKNMQEEYDGQNFSAGD